MWNEAGWPGFGAAALLVLAGGCATGAARPATPAVQAAPLAQAQQVQPAQVEAPDPCVTTTARRGPIDPTSRSADPSLPQTPLPTTGALSVSAQADGDGQPSLQLGTDEARCQARRAGVPVADTAD